MIRRRPRGETTLSKATYDHKRPRYDPPSPERIAAEQQESMRNTEKKKNFDQRMKEDITGLMEENFGCSIEEYLKKKNYYR